MPHDKSLNLTGAALRFGDGMSSLQWPQQLSRAFSGAETRLKYTAVRGLSAEALRASVPARYRTQLPSVLPEPAYTRL